jgi:hypothetical protein
LLPTPQINVHRKTPPKVLQGLPIAIRCFTKIYISSPKESQQNQRGKRATIPRIPLVTKGENFRSRSGASSFHQDFPLGR